MPTYEYECKSCRHRFDKLQSMSSKPAASCPRCKKPAKRLISSGAGLLFKGSGFYATDHRSPSYKKKAESEKGPSGGGCGKPSCPKP